jgi:hypothetical protein
VFINMQMHLVVLKPCFLLAWMYSHSSSLSCRLQPRLSILTLAESGKVGRGYLVEGVQLGLCTEYLHLVVVGRTAQRRQ